MILLDTDLVSAVMKPAPAVPVVEWLDGQPTDVLYLSTVTIAEVQFGLEILPDGRRRWDLEDRFERFVADGFAYRLLPFDEKAARRFGELRARRRRLGRPMSVLDGQIAAIAKANRFAVATRNVRDFEDCGLEIVNPFDLPS